MTATKEPDIAKEIARNWDAVDAARTAPMPPQPSTGKVGYISHERGRQDIDGALNGSTQVITARYFDRWRAKAARELAKDPNALSNIYGLGYGPVTLVHHGGAIWKFAHPPFGKSKHGMTPLAIEDGRILDYDFAVVLELPTEES